MAAFNVQLLKAGLALCAKNFAGFVEAWNHVVSRSANVCGDADGTGDGYITVDNADPDHPVIRLDATKLPSSSGGGGAGENSAFGLCEDKDDEGNVTGRTIVNCWWNVGGRTHFDFDDRNIGTSDGLFCAKFTGTAFDMCEIISTTVEELEGLQKSADSYVVPLYLISGGDVYDVRTAPQVQSFEEGLT